MDLIINILIVRISDNLLIIDFINLISINFKGYILYLLKIKKK